MMRYGHLFSKEDDADFSTFLKSSFKFFFPFWKPTQKLNDTKKEKRVGKILFCSNFYVCEGQKTGI